MFHSAQQHWHWLFLAGIESPVAVIHCEEIHSVAFGVLASYSTSWISDDRGCVLMLESCSFVLSWHLPVLLCRGTWMPLLFLPTCPEYLLIIFPFFASICLHFSGLNVTCIYKMAHAVFHLFGLFSYGYYYKKLSTLCEEEEHVVNVRPGQPA